FTPIITANMNLYVNGTTGDDVLYDGSSPTISGSHGPFKTINRAVTETFRYGPSVYTMTINIANGTYPEAVSLPMISGPEVKFLGQSKTLTKVTGAVNLDTFFVPSANHVAVQNLWASAPSNIYTGAIFRASGGGRMDVDQCTSGSSPDYVFCAHANGHIACHSHNFAAGTNCRYLFMAASSSSLGIGRLRETNNITIE